jgi:ATP-dependent Lhr-like helicase
MREILVSEQEYKYLFKRAKIRLRDARTSAKNSGILSNRYLSTGSGAYLFIPWLGTRGMRTLDVLFRHPEAKARLALKMVRRNPFAFLISSEFSPAQFDKHLCEMIDTHIDMAEGLQPEDLPFTDKYDYRLTPKLLVKQYVNNQISIGEIKSQSEDLDYQSVTYKKGHE